MFAKARSYLSKRLPPSSVAFKRGIGDIEAALKHGRAANQKALDVLHADNRHSVEQVDALHRALASVERRIDLLEKATEKRNRGVDELLWAEVFNSTVSSSEWLHDKAFSPGRWSVGYSYLYVLYRVLNETNPRRILDLGLGQSSRMIAQYAAAHEGVEHVVVEHDQKWIDFFAHNYRLPDSSRLLKLDWGFVPYKEAERVRVYSGFADALNGEQFDLISIDGPLGGDMDRYARIDVLGLMPGCLAPSFVIMIDDYERDAEENTMGEMRDSLSQAGIDCRDCRYSGAKDLGLLCSTDLAFLCSM